MLLYFIICYIYKSLRKEQKIMKQESVPVTGRPSAEGSDPVCKKQGYLKEDFRLFHLKDKKKRIYEPHYHDFLKITLLLEGNVSYVVEGRSYQLCPYDIVLVNRGQIHRPEVEDTLPYERILLYLSPAFLNRFSQEGAALDHCFKAASYRHSQVLRLKEDAKHALLSLLKRLERSQNWQDQEFAGSLYSRILCLEFLIQLNRFSSDSNAQYLPTSTLDYRVSGLISYINEHLEEELKIDRLSSLISMSPYHMMRTFKEETGRTIGSYITEKRLLKARELLEGGTKATEACYICGFNNYSTFLRAYKQHFGYLPKRQKFMKKEELSITEAEPSKAFVDG